MAGPDAAYVEVAGKILAFDAATGAQRTVAIGHSLVDVGRDRMFTFGLPDAQSPSLHALDLSGNVVWSRPMGSMPTPFGVVGGVATPDGGIIVYGTGSSMSDPSTQVSFAAGINASGTIEWVFPAGPGSARTAALTTHGEFLVASERKVGGSLFAPEIDSYLTVVTPAGVLRTLSIEGRGAQFIDGLAGAPEGLAWLQVDSARAGDGYPDPVMEIGEHTFAGEGMYLFELVP